jgi:transcription elongation factor Elf1
MGIKPKRKQKPKMFDAERTANMKHVFNVLMCPHQWGAAKKVTVKDGKGKAKPYDAELYVCGLCGINRVQRADGTASMYPPQGLSDAPPQEGKKHAAG